MINKVFLSRPVLILIWGEDVPVSESKNVARQILLDLHPFGNEDFISFDEFIGWFNQVFGYPALSDQVHYRKENERFVGGLETRKSRPALSVLVGPEISEHLDILLKHRLRRHRCS